MKSSDGAVIDSGNGADVTSYTIAADGITVGEVYTLKVSAIPTNGTEADGMTATVQFRRDLPPVVGDYIMSNGVVTGYTGSDSVIEIPSEDYDGNPITAIGSGAFKENAVIACVTIPASVIEVQASAFEGCGNLETVIITNSVTVIDDYAFRNCENLESMITFD